MSTEGADLVDFLRARLGKDERVALAAADEGKGNGVWRQVTEGSVKGVLDSDGFVVMADDGWTTEVHIARHDPARALREVEAKRRIIERERWHPHGGLECGGHPGPYLPHDDYGPGYCGRMDEENPTLRDLALVYADHPDYREEWKP